MASSILQAIRVSLRLDNGVDSQGNTKTVGVSLGTLNKATFDADKVLAIANALEPCLNKEIDSVQKTEVSTLTAA